MTTTGLDALFDEKKGDGSLGSEGLAEAPREHAERMRNAGFKFDPREGWELSDDKGILTSYVGGLDAGREDGSRARDYSLRGRGYPV